MRKVCKLREEETRVRFEKKVGQLVRSDAPDLWECFKDGLPKACDEVCGKQ